MDVSPHCRSLGWLCAWIISLSLFASGAELVEWQRTFDGVPTRPTVLSDGRIAVGLRFPSRSRPNPPIESFFLLSSTGSTLWSFPTQYGISAGPCVGPDDTIYLTHLVLNQGISTDTLVAFDPDGTVKWSRTLPSLSADDLSIGGDGTILIPGQNGNSLMAYFESGERMWTNPSLRNLNRHPAIGLDGTLFLSALPGFVIGSATGAQIWAPTNNQYAWGPSAVDRSGNAWAFNELGDLVSFSPAGSILSSRPIPKTDPPIPVRVTPSATSSYEPVIGEEGNIYLVGARLPDRARIVSFTEGGAFRWGVTITNRVLSPPAVARGGTLFVAGDTEVLEFSDSGEWVRSMAVGYQINLPPILTPSGQLLITGTNQLTSLKPGFEFPTLAPWPMFQADPRGSSSASTSLTNLVTPTIRSSEVWVGANVILWDLPKRPSLYKILRAVKGEPLSAAITLATVSSADGKYKDTTATPGVRYRYWIQATRGALTSEISSFTEIRSTPSRKLWSYSSDRIAGSLRIGLEGNLYFSEARGTESGVTALRPTGELLWRNPALGPVFSVSSRGNLYVGGPTMQELTPGGDLVRSVDLGSSLWSSPAIAPNGTLWLAGGFNLILNLNSDFTTNWVAETQSNVGLGPLSLSPSGSAFLSQGGQTVLSVTPTGEWKALPYDLSIQSDRFTVGLDGHAIVPDLKTGTVLSMDSSGEIKKLPGLVQRVQKLTLSDAATNLYSVVLTTNVVPSTPTDFSHYETDLIKLSPDGTELWKKAVPASTALCAITEGGGAIISQLGSYSALSPDGTLLWSVESVEPGTAVASVDGRVYLVAPHGIVCLETDVRIAEAGWIAESGDSHGSYIAKSTSLRNLEVRRLAGNSLTVGLAEVSKGPAVLLWSSNFQVWNRWTDRWFTNGAEEVSIPVDGAPGARFLKAVAP